MCTSSGMVGEDFKSGAKYVLDLALKGAIPVIAGGIASWFIPYAAAPYWAAGVVTTVYAVVTVIHPTVTKANNVLDVVTDVAAAIANMAGGFLSIIAGLSMLWAVQKCINFQSPTICKGSLQGGFVLALSGGLYLLSYGGYSAWKISHPPPKKSWLRWR